MQILKAKRLNAKFSQPQQIFFPTIGFKGQKSLNSFALLQGFNIDLLNPPIPSFLFIPKENSISSMLYLLLMLSFLAISCDAYIRMIKISSSIPINDVIAPNKFLRNCKKEGGTVFRKDFFFSSTHRLSYSPYMDDTSTDLLSPVELGIEHICLKKAIVEGASGTPQDWIMPIAGGAVPWIEPTSEQSFKTSCATSCNSQKEEDHFSDVFPINGTLVGVCTCYNGWPRSPTNIPGKIAVFPPDNRGRIPGCLPPVDHSVFQSKIFFI